MENKVPAPVSMEEDTRTRKTVRLRAITPAASAENAAPAAIPAAPKPAAPAAVPVPPKPAAPVAVPAPPKPAAPVMMDGEDTTTRKTVKLKPVMPAAAAPQTAASVAPATMVEDDTRTRKTVMIRPATAPAAAPAAPAAAPDSDDRTVKIQRPKPVAPSLVKPVAPAVTAVPPKAPGLTTPAPKPVAPVKQAVPPVKPVVPQIPAEKKSSVPVAEVSNGILAKIHTGLTVAALVFLLATAVFTAAQYFGICQGVKCDIPGMSSIK